MTRALLDLKKSALRLDLKDGAYLRPLQPEDVTMDYVDGLNDPEVHRYMEAPRKQRQTLEGVRAYVAANAADAQAVLFGLYVGGILRGTVRLHDVESGGGTATVGIALFDRRAWGQGLGRAAIAAVANYATGELGLTRLEAGIIAANRGSIQAFERAGFRRAGDKPADPELGPVGLWVLEAGTTR
jgi:RimJ/RimL family protein N-acetyltransferase